MEGYRAMGGEAWVICSWEAAGVMAAAVAYCLLIRRGRLVRRMDVIAFEGGCIRGGILFVVLARLQTIDS